MLKDTSQTSHSKSGQDQEKLQYQRKDAEPGLGLQRNDPIFTKNHPKFVHSFPITGKNAQISYDQELRSRYEETNKSNEKHMAEYGSIMMQNRNSNFN